MLTLEAGTLSLPLLVSSRPLHSQPRCLHASLHSPIFMTPWSVALITCANGLYRLGFSFLETSLEMIPVDIHDALAGDETTYLKPTWGMKSIMSGKWMWLQRRCWNSKSGSPEQDPPNWGNFQRSFHCHCRFARSFILTCEGVILWGPGLVTQSGLFILVQKMPSQWHMNPNLDHI